MPTCQLSEGMETRTWVLGASAPRLGSLQHLPGLWQQPQQQQQQHQFPAGPRSLLPCCLAVLREQHRQKKQYLCPKTHMALCSMVSMPSWPLWAPREANKDTSSGCPWASVRKPFSCGCLVSSHCSPATHHCSLACHASVCPGYPDPIITHTFLVPWPAGVVKALTSRSHYSVPGTHAPGPPVSSWCPALMGLMWFLARF
jgi:hypothetical protein